MNRPNFFLGNSVIVLASLVIFISALLIPANPNFEGFTLTNPQLIEKFPSSVSQSEVHEADNKVGLSDFISALNSKNKITGMPAGSPGSCAVVDQIDPGGRDPDCVNYVNYMDTKSGMPRVDYALIVAGCDPGEWTNPDPDVGVFNDGTFCYYNWMECGPASMDACNAAEPYFIIGDYVGGGGGGSGVTDFGWDPGFSKATSFDENSITSNGQLIGTLQCDDTSGCTYAEASAPQLLYTIASNGQVTMNNAAMDNYEEYPVLTISVTATGVTSGSVTADIDINMNDLSETPSFSAQSCAIDENTISNPSI